MSLRRREALARFPELAREIADADNADYLWWRLPKRLQDAYQNDPPDADRMAAIYDYALFTVLDFAGRL